MAGDQGLKYSGPKKNIPLGTLPKSPHVSREAGMLMEVKRLADAQEMTGSSLRASFDDPYFRIADPPLGAGYSR